MTITKYCSSLQAAESYQNRLYNKYKSVQLIQSPLFGNGEGLYVWRVG